MMAENTLTVTFPSVKNALATAGFFDEIIWVSVTTVLIEFVRFCDFSSMTQFFVSFLREFATSVKCS